MKKNIIIIVLLVIAITGCKKIERNYLYETWKLDNSLKPDINFERSSKNNSYGLFYIDTQITFEEYIKYLKKLKDNKMTVNWKYSDIDSIEKLEDEYKNKDSKDTVFEDGYINFEMCNDKICIFTQWVDKEIYNSINKDKENSYSLKVEPLDIEKNES